MYWANLAVIGLTVGAIYALYGLGITLIYKATRVPNFAHGAIGMVGAYVFYKTWERSQGELRIPTVKLQVPFFGWAEWVFTPPALPMWAAILLALLVTGLVGLVIERIMRFLEGAPTVLLIVATLGLLLVITGLVSDLFSPDAQPVPNPVPENAYHFGGLNVTNNAIVIAVLSLGLAVGFGVFFRSTNLGIAIRATADSREVSRLLGINANAVAAFAWAAGSMLAAIAGILITPRGQLDQATLFTFIVPGFAAALLGGFTSLVGTFLGGLVLGLVESFAIGAPWPGGWLEEIFTKSGTPQFVAFLVIIVVLMTRPRFIFKGIRTDEDTGVAFAKRGGLLGPEDRVRQQLDRAGALPVILRDWSVGKWVLAAMVLSALLAVPVFAVSFWSTVLATGTVFALIALSIVVLTGWTGQISMAALTFAGAGAWGAAVLGGSMGLPFWLVIPLTGVVGIPIALLIGVPSLRLRGFFLAIATMAFALVGETWLFTLRALTTRNKIPRGPLSEQITQPTYLVGLVVAGLVFLAVWNLSKTRVARAWFALRDSETTAVSMGIDPVRYKLLAFVASGFIAGVAGGLFGYVNRVLTAPSFSLLQSLQYVTFAVIAGVGEIFGAFLVGVFLVAPSLFAQPASGVNQAPFILSGVVAVLVAIQYPNGLAAFYRRLVRPFDPSERIAWASADSAGAPEPVAAAATAADLDAEDVRRAAVLVGADDAPRDGPVGAGDDGGGRGDGGRGAPGPGRRRSRARRATTDGGRRRGQG